MIWMWVWLGGCIAFSVPIARFLLNDITYREHDHGDYVMAAIGGVIVSPFWPLLIPGYYVYWMLKRGETDR